MAGLQINRITNANVYLDGNSLYGRAEEVDLGEIKYIMNDFTALGMFGKTKLPDGLEAIEGKIIWTGLYGDSALLAASPFKSVSLQCASSIRVITSQGQVAEQPLATFLTVTFNGYQLGAYKAHEPVKYESPFTATSVRQLIDGREVLMIDVFNNILRVDGADQLAQARANMGM